jgi:hypothetical protein
MRGSPAPLVLFADRPRPRLAGPRAELARLYRRYGIVDDEPSTPPKGSNPGSKGCPL